MRAKTPTYKPKAKVQAKSGSTRAGPMETEMIQGVEAMVLEWEMALGTAAATIIAPKNVPFISVRACPTRARRFPTIWIAPPAQATEAR